LPGAEYNSIWLLHQNNYFDAIALSALHFIQNLSSQAVITTGSLKGATKMRFISAVVVFLILFSLGMAQTIVQNSSDAATEQELVRIAQELYDAVPSGDKAVWEKYVADDVIYTDENWHILTKKQLIDSLSPLPKGYSGSIRIANVQSRINGDSAVLSYRALEEEYIFGQKLSPVYLVTDTYFKRHGRWQMIASHVIVLPSERKPITVNPKNYQSIVGQYELTPGVTYTITLEDNKLMGQRTGRAKEEMLPADENTFFLKGTIRGEKVFVRDASGRATEMLDRRENNDLVWKKVK
jgi:hypothetical protein